MPNTALNRSVILLLTNKSGGAVAYGDVVVLDTGTAAAFTTTAVLGYLATRVGVVMEPAGIANDAVGLVVVSGYAPKINLSSSASLGDYIRPSGTVKLGVPHAAPHLTGDFAQVLGTGTGPAAVLGTVGGDGISAQLWLSGRGALPSLTDGFTVGTQVEMTTNKQNISDPAFPTGVKRYGEWEIAMPSDWDGGTVTAQFFWTADSTSTNSVVWGLQGRAYADADAIDQAWGSAVEVTDANQATAYSNNVSAATAAITLAGSPAGGQLVKFRAYRLGSGADDLAATAILVGVQVTYTRK